MNIARIAYLNTEPFFHYWKSQKFKLHPGFPRALAGDAHNERIIAGPLPLVECWSLEDRYEPLADWGISVRQKSGSVFVFSKKPFSQLDNVTIGVTQESSTSVVLCSVLLEKRYGNHVTLRRGFWPEDEARLVIGDQAIMMAQRAPADGWTYMTDLATEWWRWQRKPFVFARWVVQKDLDPKIREELENDIRESFVQGIGSLPEMTLVLGEKYELPPAFVWDYLQGFVYNLDKDALQSIDVFRQLAENTVPNLAGLMAPQWSKA